LKIAFSFIGGVHQFLHGAPVAAALSRRPGVEVHAYVATQPDAVALAGMLRALGGEKVRVVEMRLPLLPASVGASLKVARLAWWACRMRSADAIVALERTSALLRRLPGRCPPLIQIPHGVGGARRAGGGGVDRRFSLFQLALVAGSADRRSTLEQGLLREEQVVAVGQVKLAGLRRMGKLERSRLFANEKPTIIYNPHFHPRRGTWENFGQPLIEAVRSDGSFNLVVAPHVRLFQDVPDDVRRSLEALSDPDWLIVDTGSQRSIDMTYTLGGDIYLGDFSSQLYEWLIYPRPCVFIDQIADGGMDDTKLPTMWSLGETVTDFAQVLPALHRAAGRHATFREAQDDAVRDAMGDPAIPADEAAAGAICDFVSRQSRVRRRPSDR
jgi:hypothetical protein